MSFGSAWKKWNLHIHTPDTVFNNQFKAVPPHTDKWDTYLDLLSKSDASVLGITDYFSIDGYEKVRSFKESGGLPNVELIIPNIELRLMPVTESEKGINFHILCDPSVVDKLDHHLFSELRYTYNGQFYRCNKQGLTDLGRAFKGNDLNDVAAYKEGANQFKVDFNSLRILYENSKFLREHTIRVVSNRSEDGASGLRHDSMAATREEVYRLADIIFSGQPNDRGFFLGKSRLSADEVIAKYRSLKPCAHGCDAHSNDKICHPDLDRFTFIKADRTFSGLKQIIFEPESRIVINNLKPRSPGKSINTLNVNFPSGSKMDNEKFCFGYSFKLNFSPFFTCIIGGRGTGKSTLLNLIGAKLNKSDNDFFSSRTIKDSSGKKIQVADSITIDGDQDENSIEFISQNQIEEFAKDTVKLTNAIYSRIINLDTDDSLAVASDALERSIDEMQRTISLRLTLRHYQDSIKGKERQVETFLRITQSFESDTYKELNKKIEDIVKEINEQEYSSSQYYKLLDQLEHSLSEYRPNESDNSYTHAGQELSSAVETIVSAHRLRDFNAELIKTSKLKEQYTTARAEMQSYLDKSQVSKEDQKDISNANATIGKLKSEILEDTRTMEQIQRTIDELNLNTVEQQSEDYRNLLIEHIRKIQERLDSLNTNKKLVKTIDLKYEFDYSKATEQIFRDFQKLFEPALKKFQEKTKFDIPTLERILANNKLQPEHTVDTYLLLIENDPTRSGAKQFLKELFSDVLNFEVYKLLVKKVHLDHFTYKKIVAFYDSKSLDKASFGQRCTAALVILLLLGNNPIIIDEPEAHLDSMLISNYLVEVIKTRKNERQIIFATHNANFVINGDAELIHILDVDDQSTLTKIVSTTIENEATRENLIALEGGQEAFQKREHRYSNKTII